MAHWRTAAGAAAILVTLCVPSGALPREHAVKAVTVTGLTTQGYEVKAVIHDALILQKGAEVFWCILHLGKTAPLSYVSECYSVR